MTRERGHDFFWKLATWLPRSFKEDTSSACDAEPNKLSRRYESRYSNAIKHTPFRMSRSIRLAWK